MTGSIIAPVTSVDKMTATFTVNHYIKGKQVPEEFEGGAISRLNFLFINAEEQAGLTATDTLINEEPLEIKAIP